MVGLNTQLIKQCQYLGIPVCNATGKLQQKASDYYPIKNGKRIPGFYDWEDNYTSQCFMLRPPEELLVDCDKYEQMKEYVEKAYEWRNEIMQHEIDLYLYEEAREREKLLRNETTGLTHERIRDKRHNKFKLGTFTYDDGIRLRQVKVLKKTGKTITFEFTYLKKDTYRKKTYNKRITIGEHGEERVKWGSSKNSPWHLAHQSFRADQLFKPKETPTHAAKILQRAWRKCRYNPEYEMCHKVQIQMMLDDGYEFAE